MTDYCDADREYAALVARAERAEAEVERLTKERDQQELFKVNAVGREWENLRRAEAAEARAESARAALEAARTLEETVRLVAAAREVSAAWWRDRIRYPVTKLGTSVAVSALDVALAALDAQPTEPARKKPWPGPTCTVCGHPPGFHLNGTGECMEGWGTDHECMCPAAVVRPASPPASGGGREGKP
jgi:glutamine synthetase adenylyltransferase